MELEGNTDCWAFYFHYEIVKIPSCLVFCDRLYYCLSLLFTFYSKNVFLLQRCFMKIIIVCARMLLQDCCKCSLIISSIKSSRLLF